jgi:hypothetical protein
MSLPPLRGSSVSGMYVLECIIAKYFFSLLSITSLLVDRYIHSRFIPEWVAEVSQIFLRGTHVLSKLVRYEEHCNVTGGKFIAVFLQSISGAGAINPLVAFYDIHRGKRELLFFYFVPDTTKAPLLWVGLIKLMTTSMYNMYVFTKKSIYVCIYPLSKIHNTSLISA